MKTRVKGTLSMRVLVDDNLDWKEESMYIVEWSYLIFDLFFIKHSASFSSISFKSQNKSLN